MSSADLAFITGSLQQYFVEQTTPSYGHARLEITFVTNELFILTRSLSII